MLAEIMRVPTEYVSIEIAKSLKQRAIDIGFDAVGIASINSLTSPFGKRMAEFYREWLARKCNASMTYLERHLSTREQPQKILHGTASILMLAVSYQRVLRGFHENFTSVPHEKSDESETSRAEKVSGSCSENPTENRFAPTNNNVIADYACGNDYHLFCREHLKILADYHRELLPQEKCRGVVDTAPLWEKFWAREAGLGFIGHNTMLIIPQRGSRFFLAALLTTAKLLPDLPLSASEWSCRECRKCIDACPTRALSPRWLDARRCINYWTIEHRGDIPERITSRLGERFIGCDTCQDVCPYNAATQDQFPDLGIPQARLDSLTRDEFQRDYGDTPLARVGWEQLLYRASASAVEHSESANDSGIL